MFTRRGENFYFFIPIFRALSLEIPFSLGAGLSTRIKMSPSSRWRENECHKIKERSADKRCEESRKKRARWTKKLRLTNGP